MFVYHTIYAEYCVRAAEQLLVQVFPSLLTAFSQTTMSLMQMGARPRERKVSVMKQKDTKSVQGRGHNLRRGQILGLCATSPNVHGRLTAGL